MHAFFKIKNYPKDIYNAVGQIIQASQEWERDFKKLAIMLNVPLKKIDNASLNKLNEALKKNNMISEKEYDDLKKVIDIRNHINHNFFLTDFQKPFDDFDEKMKELEKILNESQFLIFEATDVINNKIDKLEGDDCMRPTIFDGNLV